MYNRKEVMKRIRAIKDEDEAENALEGFDEIKNIEDEDEKRESIKAFLAKLPKVGGILFCCKKNKKYMSHRKKKKRKKITVGQGKQRL